MRLLRAVKRMAKNIYYLGTHDLANEENELSLIYRAIRHTEDLMQTNMVFKQDNSINVPSGGDRKFIARSSRCFRGYCGYLALLKKLRGMTLSILNDYTDKCIQIFENRH